MIWQAKRVDLRPTGLADPYQEYAGRARHGTRIREGNER